MSATVSRPRPAGWLKTLLRGQPHQVIGDGEPPYLLRWFLLPHNKFANVYLHKFTGSDDPDAFHDHPWPFASLLLSGSYLEHTPGGRRRRRRGSVAFRKPSFRHRIEIPTDDAGRAVACRTLVVTGPKVPRWGFWCPRTRSEERFIPWHEFGDGACAEFTDPRGLP